MTEQSSNACYEIPAALVRLLRTIGPIHEDAANGYHSSVLVVISEDEKPRGFLVEQRLANREPEVPTKQGLQYQVPIKAVPGGEATYVYVENLPAALEITQRAR